MVLQRELSAIYLGTLLCATGKFHQAIQDRIAGAVKTSHSIHSKAINRHFLHTIPIVEYCKSCVLSKLLYASAIWAVGSSKDAWNKLERVKKDYFKTHFTLHKKTPSALLWLELGIQPVQVEALISAIQFYQQISNMSQQRLPCMALEASKSMQSVWWQAFLKWLKEWDVQPDQVLDMDPLDIRNHAFQKLWKDVNMDRLQKLHILRFGRKNKSVMEKYLSETWSFKMSRAILAFRIQATPWAMTHRFKYEAGELLPPCHL